MRNMLSYETAIKLKEAGYPQEPMASIQYYAGNPIPPEARFSPPGTISVCFPGLLELIEACAGPHGQRFRWLSNEKTYWLAQARPMHAKSKQYPDSPIKQIGPDAKGKGSSPEEAVAELWLSLQKNNKKV